MKAESLAEKEAHQLMKEDEPVEAPRREIFSPETHTSTLLESRYLRVPKEWGSRMGYTVRSLKPIQKKPA